MTTASSICAPCLDYIKLKDTSLWPSYSALVATTAGFESDPGTPNSMDIDSCEKSNVDDPIILKSLSPQFNMEPFAMLNSPTFLTKSKSPSPVVSVKNTILSPTQLVLNSLCRPEATVHKDIMRTLLTMLWQEMQVMNGISPENMTGLDNNVENIVGLQACEFFERLMHTVFQLSASRRFPRNGESLNQNSSWKIVLDAVRVLNINEGVVQNAQSRLLKSILNNPQCSIIANPYRGQAEIVKKWDPEQIVVYLDDMGLSCVANVFRENHVDCETFLSLTYDDLKEDLGIENETIIVTIIEVIAQIL